MSLNAAPSEHSPITGGQTVWLGRRRADDAALLDQWRHVPLNYRPGQVVDKSWHTDHYEFTIGAQASAGLFQRAGDLLLRYEFYPHSVLAHVSDFSRADRAMQVGDRIVQRIHGLRLLGLPILDMLTMNEVSAVIDEPRRKGFTYVTTQAHEEMGEWSALVRWQDDGALRLIVHAVSRPAYHVPARSYSLMRRLQQRAHRLGVRHFRDLVLTPQR